MALATPASNIPTWPNQRRVAGAHKVAAMPAAVFTLPLFSYGRSRSENTATTLCRSGALSIASLRRCLPEYLYPNMLGAARAAMSVARRAEACAGLVWPTIRVGCGVIAG